MPIGGDGNIIESKPNRQNMKLSWGLWGVIVMKRWRKRTYNLWTTTSIGDFANQDTLDTHTRDKIVNPSCSN